MPDLIHDSIREPPAEAGRVRAEHGIDIGRKLVPHRLEVFKDPAPRPIDVGTFIEDYIDEGTAQVGEPTDSLDPRGRKEGRRNGIGNLVLDEVGAPARPFGIDNHLGVGEVWNRVEGYVLEGIVTPCEGKKDKEKDNKLVPGTILYDLRYHLSGSPLLKSGTSFPLFLIR